MQTVQDRDGWRPFFSSGWQQAVEEENRNIFYILQ